MSPRKYEDKTNPKTFPVTLNFGTQPDDIVGKIILKEGEAKLLAEGLMKLSTVTRRVKGDSFDLELVSVSLVAKSPMEAEFAATDETVRGFFREARQLVKDELREGDSVLPVILNKLRLLAEWKRLNEEGEGS